MTGKASDEFKKKIANLNNSYIRKDEADYLDKLKTFVKERSAKIFQWYSYIPARILSRNPNENNSFLFDGNFISIFDNHLKENDICEFYLFDKQGSYIFLDSDANLSWLFIRNATGIENSIILAQKYNAPKHIIDALKSKECILSLYEKSDFEQRKSINWDDYLLPASIFESDRKFLGFFSNLVSSNNSNEPQYYYSFTNQFPDHGIKKENILSYKEFLKSQ